jgi:hypothetical protein
MYDGTRVAGPADLRAFLLRHREQFVRNVAEKLLTYALGRGVEYHDMPAVRAIAAEAAGDEYRFESLITAVVQSEPFRSSRSAGAAATTTAALPDEGVSRR